MRWTIFIFFRKRPSERELRRFQRDLAAAYAPGYLKWSEVERPGFLFMASPQEDFGSEPGAFTAAVDTLATDRFGANLLRVSAHPSQAARVFHFNGTALVGGTTITLPKRSRTLLIDNKDTTNDLEVSFDLGENYQTIPAGASLSLDAPADVLILKGDGMAVEFSGLLT